MPVGIAGLFTTDGPLSTLLRQNGKELFTPDGLAFEAADAQAFFDLMVEFQKAKAIGTAENVSEEATKPLDQNAITVGTSAMQLSNSNQLEAFTAAAGKELTILRLPSLAGKSTERKAWYKASQLFSASARTKNPEAAVKFINWLVNSPESANINLAERGIPANTEMLALVEPKLSAPQQQVAKFIADIKADITTATPIAPPPGGGTIALVLVRYATDVLFGRTSTADAGTKFVEELKSNLQV